MGNDTPNEEHREQERRNTDSVDEGTRSGNERREESDKAWPYLEKRGPDDRRTDDDRRHGHGRRHEPQEDV